MSDEYEHIMGIDYDSFTWYREFSHDDMTGLELMRDGLMKGLADIHVKIEDAHRQQIKEERDDAIAHNNELQRQVARLEAELSIALALMLNSQIADFQEQCENNLQIPDSPTIKKPE